MKYPSFILCLLVGLLPRLSAQNTIGSDLSWQVFFEQDYYTAETSADLIIVPPVKWQGWTAKVSLSGKSFPLVEKLVQLQETVSVPIALAPVSDTSIVRVTIQIGAERFQSRALLRKLPAQFNAVKINRRTGGLIVDELPYFPAGFYCYPPVQETLAEEEVVRGFNMMSPYQVITPATLPDRIRYLDRCAALGMKVHYNLLSVAGGGGVGNGRANYDSLRRRQFLKAEIEAVKDHPALLGWYISDEPTGAQISAASLKPTYELIKQLDPYHPVSIVFMNPKRAAEYREVMDIVMADPYPIPNRTPDEVSTVIADLKAAFRYELPVWLVPQAFGGNEHWGREPSPGELRLMTWLGALEGATGVQYFIRHGLSSFPKSTLVWDAASAAIQELLNLSPFLLEYEASAKLPVMDPDLEARWFQKGDAVVLIAVNTSKQPKNFLLNTAALKLPLSGKVLFEDRNIKLRENGRLQDIIEGFGRRIYYFDLNQKSEEDLQLEAQNLLLDPSFENSLVPGTPAACYFKLRGDRGAHAQLDTRLATEGRHSLRLTTPVYDNGLDIELFPVQLQTGQAYAFSFWAKARQPNKQLLVQLGRGVERRFALSTYWQEFSWVFTANGDEATRNSKTSILLSLLSQGVAWVDQIQLVPEPLIVFKEQPFAEATEVKVLSAQAKDPSISINYTLDGADPNITTRAYTGPIRIANPLTFRASVTKDNQRYINGANIAVNMLPAESVVYRFPYYGKYAAGGEKALTDGKLGSLRYTDGHWQGWNKNHIDLTLDYGKEQAMQSVHLRFLSDMLNWIYPPTEVKIYGSTNGKRYREIARRIIPAPAFDTQVRIREVVLDLGGKDYRYLRVEALRPAALPKDHPSAGANPFVFLDEVMVARGVE
ncbi:MAG TPA: chitobiase/beta-hexosaminidase C-terminal domain-containing protein [Saprospiraceae bacterium]|nr:chitobiase/beta-hexosaminidase C-terminal domain-containing protein [Saprospiraceae bacterium]